MIKTGDRVLYVLNADDAVQINRRRTSGHSIAERIQRAVWPAGAQAHIGNDVKGGDAFPGVVVSVSPVESESVPPVNLQVALDGTDCYWATSRHEDGTGKPGTFSRLR